MTTRRSVEGLESRPRRRKQDRRLELLPPDEVRARKVRKAAEADRALFIAAAGLVGWQRELERRRAERNERARERTRQAIAAKRLPQQSDLFADDREIA